MNTNIKLYLISGVLAIVLGIGFIIYIIFYSGNNTDKVIATTKLGDVTINNIFTQYTDISDTLYLADEPTYSIIFSKYDNNFTITLLEYSRENLISARTQAEAKLQEILGVSKEDFCKLTIHENVPASYNEQYSKLDYGVSFCSGGLDFEPETETSVNSEQINLDENNEINELR